MRLNGFLSMIFLIAGFVAVAPAYGQSDIDRLVEQTGIEAGPVASRDFRGWREPAKIVAWDIPGLAEVLEELPRDVEVVIVRSESEAAASVDGADAFIGHCSKSILEAAQEVVWVQVFSSGVERCLAVERVRNGDVLLTNMQKMSSPVIAEHVTAMVLSLSRGLIPFAKRMPEGQWSRTSRNVASMQSYGGKIVLIAGLGGIGTETARRLAALDMRVIGTRRSSREGPAFVEYVGLSDELTELAARADFIVNALPLTPETEGLFDAEFFAAAKRGAYFVNVGRGKTVVTSDLIAALESGQIAGAALDVTDPEPLPPNHPLWQQENVLITPHVSSRGGNRIRHLTLARENLRRFMAGEPLLNVVDPELGY
jgi:phosphoglycerate dehydrogenase-like enzyme